MTNVSFESMKSKAYRTTIVLAVTGMLLTVALSNSGASQMAYAQPVQISAPTAGQTAEWWQWALSYPIHENPILDQTGEQCQKGNLGDVFFLAGTAGGAVERDCTISEGQTILIPIVNFVCGKEFPEETEESLADLCGQLVDQQKNLKLVIDGRQVQNLEDYRVTQPTFFTVTLPEDNLFGAPGGTSIDAVSDGYWVLIEGFSAGQHTIKVSGKLHGQTDFGKIDAKVVATYNLTVE